MEMQSPYSVQGFSGMTSMAKSGLSVCCPIVGRMKTVGSRKTTLCAPSAEKCKIVSYIKKYLLSHIRAPFLFERRMICSYIFVLGIVCSYKLCL